MNNLQKALLSFAGVAFFAAFAQAANTPQTGTIVAENSVNCGSKAESHKRNIDLLCQEYVIRGISTEYHVRQEKPANRALIPINTKVEFKIDKNKIKFKAAGKSYDYIVVSEGAVAFGRP